MLTSRKPVFSYSCFLPFRSFLLLMAIINGMIAKKENTAITEINTHSLKDVDSVSAIKIKIMATPDSTALIFAVMRIMASIKTEMARKNKITTKG